MNNDKKLYKIENKLGTFYIVAGTFDEAANELKARLDQADYGFLQYRDIPAIEHVATQSFYNNELKQSFSDSKPNLIISGSDPICQREFAEQMALKCEECEKLKHDYDQTAADLADANEQLLEMQAEAEKKQKAYDEYVEKAEKAYGDLLDENRRLKEPTDEQESLYLLQQKLDDALAENRQLHERLTGVTATTGAYMIAVERERQDGLTDDEARSLHAQFLAYILVPALPTEETGDRFHTKPSFRYDAERAEASVAFWEEQLKKEQTLPLPLPVMEGSDYHNRWFSRWLRRNDSRQAPQQDILLPALNREGPGAGLLFHICFQVWQTAVANFYPSVFPLLFGGGKSDPLHTALTGEADTINAVMKYQGYSSPEQVYNTELPIILGTLNTMSKEAKEIEKMNAKIKRKG